MLQRVVCDRLRRFPAVCLLGPRQSGKTTLAHTIAADRPAIYLDLEAPADRAKLSDPALYLAAHRDKLVILDEVQRLPGLFEILRGLIDAERRRGCKAGHFLLLGSASPALLRQSGESLAGRVAYLELAPFSVLEVGAEALDRLWVRGGFPDSFLADDDHQSLLWRESFLRTYLERDIPAFGPRVPAETLRRWQRAPESPHFSGAWNSPPETPRTDPDRALAAVTRDESGALGARQLLAVNGLLRGSAGHRFSSIRPCAFRRRLAPRVAGFGPSVPVVGSRAAPAPRQRVCGTAEDLCATRDRSHRPPAQATGLLRRRGRRHL